MANPSPPAGAPPVGAASTSGSSSGVQSPPPKYTLQPPARQTVTPGVLAGQFVWGLKVLLRLVRHTVGVFNPAPTAATPLTLAQPGGCISSEMLQVCEFVANDSETRLTKLETKAMGLLSLIAVVIPLAASAAVFIRQNEMPRPTAVVTLTLTVLAMLWFLLGLIAALRAVAVRRQEALFLSAVIDHGSDRVRAYSDDFFGRGLLHDAAYRQAICDHIADFVRGAQVFLVIGVTLVAIAAASVLFRVRESTQTIQGTVVIDPASLRAIQEGIDARMAGMNSRIKQLESDIELLRQTQSEAHTNPEIERISKELAELRRLVDTGQQRDDPRAR